MFQKKNIFKMMLMVCLLMFMITILQITPSLCDDDWYCWEYWSGPQCSGVAGCQSNNQPTKKGGLCVFECDYYGWKETLYCEIVPK